MPKEIKPATSNEIIEFISSGTLPRRFKNQIAEFKNSITITEMMNKPNSEVVAAGMPQFDRWDGLNSVSGWLGETYKFKNTTPMQYGVNWFYDDLRPEEITDNKKHQQIILGAQLRFKSIINNLDFRSYASDSSHAENNAIIKQMSRYFSKELMDSLYHPDKGFKVDQEHEEIWPLHPPLLRSGSLWMCQYRLAKLKNKIAEQPQANINVYSLLCDMTRNRRHEELIDLICFIESFTEDSPVLIKQTFIERYKTQSKENQYFSDLLSEAIRQPQMKIKRYNDVNVVSLFMIF